MKLKLPWHDVGYVPVPIQPYRISPSANGRAEWTGESGGTSWLSRPREKAWELSSKENSASCPDVRAGGGRALLDPNSP